MAAKRVMHRMEVGLESIDSAPRRLFDQANSADESAEVLINRFWELYRQLAAAPSLEPSDYVTTLFAEVVELCISRQPETVVERALRDPSGPHAGADRRERGVVPVAGVAGTADRS